jgi:hypothetical protein
MSKTLRILALVLALAAAGTWLATGGNRGWTKTSVPVRTVDEVTGLEAINGSANGINPKAPEDKVPDTIKDRNQQQQPNIHEPVAQLGGDDRPGW